jgi:hypothetical protein
VSRWVTDGRQLGCDRLIVIAKSRAHVRSGRVTLTARRELPFFPDQRTSPIRCASGPKSADFVAKVGHGRMDDRQHSA